MNSWLVNWLPWSVLNHAERNGYLVAREYVDEAESGHIADRPQFRRMLDEASKPEAPFQEIFIWQTQQQRKTQVLLGRWVGYGRP